MLRTILNYVFLNKKKILPFIFQPLKDEKPARWALIGQKAAGRARGLEQQRSNDVFGTQERSAVMRAGMKEQRRTGGEH